MDRCGLRRRELAPGSRARSVAGGGCLDLAEPVRGSVLVLEGEEGTANGPGQLRLLLRELELRGELRGDFHPFGELEPDRPLLGVVDGIHHVYRQTALVEDKGDSDVVDLEARRLERTRRNDD